jgi:hypothetical protein
LKCRDGDAADRHSDPWPDRGMRDQHVIVDQTHLEPREAM